MPLITRTEKGSKLTIAEMDGNLEWNNDYNPAMKMLPGVTFEFSFSGATCLIKITNGSSTDVRFDYLTDEVLGRVKLMDFNNLYSNNSITLQEFYGASALTALEDIGTDPALDLRNDNITSSAALDDLFTQLPSTTKTATINIVGNSGTAGCDPSIATAKGYTVVTA